jgi:hypothetical protein
MQQAENTPPDSDRNAHRASLRVFASQLALGIGFATLLLMFVKTNWTVLLRSAAGVADGFTGDSPSLAFLAALLPALPVLATVFGVGYAALGCRPWRRMLPTTVERAVFAPLVGGVVLSLATLGVGLISTRSVVLQALLAFAFLASATPLLQGLRHKRLYPAAAGDRIPSRWRFLFSPGILPATVLVALTAGISFLYACSPPVESDELRYHLAALATWQRDGRIHYLPHQAFSNFPMLGEMLFLLAMPLEGSLKAGAPKLVHLAFLPVTMGLLALLVGRLIRPGEGSESRHHGWLTASSFLFIPCVPVLAAWGFIDLIVVACFLGSVYLAGRALCRPRRASGTLLGLMIGGAIASKYSMLPLLGLLALVWFALMVVTRATRRHAARLAAMAALTALLLGGPWYLRNAVWTGNPVYPLAWSIFKGGEWTAESASFYADKASEKGFLASERLLSATPAWRRGTAGRVLEFLITPWTTMIYFGRFESHPIGVLPVLFAMSALGGGLRGSGRGRAGVRRRPPITMWITLAALVSWIFWFATYQSNRLLLPTLALVLALGGASFPRWPAPLAALVRSTVVLAMVYGFVVFLYSLGARPFPNGPAKADAIRVALGMEEPDLYLRDRLNYYRAARWLNGKAAAGEGALLVGEHRTLYFDLPLISSDWFDTPQPLPLIRAYPDTDDLLDRLLAIGTPYIFLNARELGLYHDFYFKPRFSPEEYQRLEAIWESPRLELMREFGRPGDERAQPPLRPEADHVLIYRIRPNHDATDRKQGELP